MWIASIVSGDKGSNGEMRHASPPSRGAPTPVRSSYKTPGVAERGVLSQDYSTHGVARRLDDFDLDGRTQEAMRSRGPSWVLSPSAPSAASRGFTPLSGEESPSSFSTELGPPGVHPRRTSRFKSPGPQAHRLPFGLMLRITMLTSATMAVINFVTIWVISFGVQAKFRTLECFIERGGVWIGIAVFVGFCMSIAALCMALVFGLSPAAGGSGAPENKGWLNGNDIDDVGKDYFSQRNLVVRQLATTCANMAGYPVGREGPTVTMGSNVAFLITQQMATSHLEQEVNLRQKRSQHDGPDTEEATTALLLDESRLAHAQRIVCTVGGACGMSMLFDSPIGGIVYMFEEITSSSWPMEVTMRAFVGTTVAALICRLLLNLCGSDVHQFVIFEFRPQPDSWNWIDIPFFFLLGVFMGPFSAYHTRACLYSGVVRQKVLSVFSAWVRPNAVKAVDAVFFIAVCALTCCLVSLHAQCFPNPFEGEDVPEEGYVRFNCEEGHYNPVGSLLLTTSEGAVKRLFSRSNRHQLHLGNECLAFIAYTLLNVGLTGVPVPSGNFTGSMLIGGLGGRILGALLEQIGVPGIAASGVYAMIGSAAMLCGFKQMCVAVVIFITHCANDMSLVIPLMVTITVSLLLNRAVNPKGFDEEQILRKKIPFLPGEPPEDMDKLSAKQLMDDMHACLELPMRARIVQIEQALEYKSDKGLQWNIFPVVKWERSRRYCVGFTTRHRLNALIEAVGGDQDDDPDQLRRTISRSVVSNSFGDLEEAFASPDSDTKFPVSRLVDKCPYTVLSDMPASLAYALFSKLNAQAAAVVDMYGVFVGIISKAGLIDKTRQIEESLEDFEESEAIRQGRLVSHAEQDEAEAEEAALHEPEHEHERRAPPAELPPVEVEHPAPRNFSLASSAVPLVNHDSDEPDRGLGSVPCDYL